jgi:hypothetical protein
MDRWRGMGDDLRQRTALENPNMSAWSVWRVASISLLGAAVLLLGATVHAADPPKAYLPGITSTDESPDGCVSCHKGDKTVKKMLDALKHRDMKDKVNSVPEDCKSCHNEADGLEPMTLIAHSMHYAKGSKSEFVTRYQGSCLHCHAVSTGSGHVTVKSGPKNW